MKRFLLFLLITFFIWSSGFGYFMYYVNQYTNDNSTITDAIAVVTGGKSRVKTSVGLLKAGYAPLIFISGVESKTDLVNFLVNNNVNLDQVIYGTHASNTNENVTEISQFATNYDLKSIRLVTSYYHMPRALSLLKNILPKKVIVVPHVVTIEPLDYGILLTEYNKYIVTNVKCILSNLL
jgi:uncharacterized SAM-binding protein YcdF (DUF218 family)